MDMATVRRALRTARTLRIGRLDLPCYLDACGRFVVGSIGFVCATTLQASTGGDGAVDLGAVARRRDTSEGAARHARYAAALGRDDAAWSVLELCALRYAGGALEAAQLDLAGFDDVSEDRMVAHMNADHGTALVEYGRLFGYPCTRRAPQLVGIDPDGFDVLADGSLRRCDFEQRCGSALDVRQALVALAARARR